MDVCLHKHRVVLTPEERDAIDAAFARMATDDEYWEQALELEAEFAEADHEALQLGGII